MLERRRRATPFQVEALEGRAAPSVVFTYTARIVRHEPKMLEITGDTLKPTVPGSHLVVTVSYFHNNNHKKEHSSFGRDTVAAAPATLRPAVGVFSARLRCDFPSWHDVYPVEITFSSYHANSKKVIESDTIPITQF